MTLSKKRKVYICVLGLAAVGLLVDRVFLGSDGLGPDEATAGPLASSTRSTGAVGRTSPGSASGCTLGEADSLAARLQALCQPGDPRFANVRDAFCPSKVWLADLQLAKPSIPKEKQSQRPKRNYRLMALMMDGNGGYAIIDGRCLRIGQELDGFTLVSLGKNSAVLESDGARIELKLETEAKAEMPQ